MFRASAALYPYKVTLVMSFPQDIVSSVSQNLEDHVNTCDHLVEPAIHTNYTDDEKSPDPNCNGTTAPEAKEAPEIPNPCVKVQLILLSEYSHSPNISRI